MGTLGNQPPRTSFANHLDAVDDHTKDVINLAKKHSLSFGDVVQLMAVFESRRRNDIAVQDGDYRDEQAGGIGKKLDALASAISELGRPDGGQ